MFASFLQVEDILVPDWVEIDAEKHVVYAAPMREHLGLRVELSIRILDRNTGRVVKQQTVVVSKSPNLKMTTTPCL